MKAAELGPSLGELGIHFVQDHTVRSSLLDGVAELVVVPEANQVSELFSLLHEMGVAYEPVGGATNTLLAGTPETPLQTVLISAKRMRHVQAIEGGVMAGAGSHIAATSAYSAREGLSGLEFARDIPGTVAGAIATDAWHPIHAYADKFEQRGLDHTAFEKYMASALRYAEVVRADGETMHMTPKDLEMANRQSILTREGGLFIVRALFELPERDPADIEAARSVICQGRKEMRARNAANNPFSTGRTLGYSFVMNHPAYGGKTANELIATTGSLPDEIVTEGMLHSQATPNIICNTGNGTADGYLKIADQIQSDVDEEHGVELALEVRVLR
jgi:UDP-N-acetylmuramate dehydrogenase